MDAADTLETAEDGARRQQLAEQRFTEQLITLQAVNLELSLADSIDDLCRLAVETAITRLGFERVSIWMIDPADPGYLLGTFGTDERGRLRDERQRRFFVSPESSIHRLLVNHLPSIHQEHSTLRNDNSEPVGMGDKAIAALWDGQQIIGMMSVDNLFTRQPMAERQLDVLDMFARTVGHLLSLKRAQQQLRRSNRALRALGECSQLVVRAASEASLLDGICQLLVNIGGYRRSWITLGEAGAPLQLAAQAGETLAAPPAWTETIETAQRTGQFKTFTDRSGAMAAAPLRLEAQPTGCLNLWAAERDRFDAQEVALLTELAGDIAFGLNTLHLRAERQQAEAAIRELNEQLEQRVRSRTAQLEATNQEMEAFSYSISHDLRGPLRSIDGYSQALLDDYAGQLAQPAQDHLRRIRAAAQRMSELIDALLSLSRLMRSEIKRRQIDLSALAREIGGELGRQHPAQPVKFTVADHLTANADLRMVRALLENLLGNAWKFTSQTAEAQIEVGALQPSEGSQIYFVRDSGAGFDMAYVNKLFGTFQRLHSVKEFPGHGVGLAIVLRIIHRHGGRVWAEGRVGEGATFYFTLEKN